MTALGVKGDAGSAYLNITWSAPAIVADALTCQR